MRRRRNVAPLVAAYAAFPYVVAGAVGLWALLRKGERDIAEEAAYEEYKTQLQPPRRAPAPPAPQTRTELTRWTPTDLERQARLDWERWRREAIPEAPPPPAKEPDPWLWLGAGAAVLGLILAVRG